MVSPCVGFPWFHPDDDPPLYFDIVPRHSCLCVMILILCMSAVGVMRCTIPHLVACSAVRGNRFRARPLLALLPDEVSVMAQGVAGSQSQLG